MSNGVEERVVKLSKVEREYLKSLEGMPIELQELLTETDGAQSISVSVALAEKCRSAFTERLAQCGFGPGYSLTGEGRTLEDLIDRFY